MTAPAAVLSGSAGGGSVTAPAAVLAASGGGGAVTAPVAVLAASGGGGAVTAPVAILSGSAGGGAVTAPVAILTPAVVSSVPIPHAIVGTTPGAVLTEGHREELTEEGDVVVTEQAISN